MVMSIQEPFISKEVDGKKMKKKKLNLENDNKVSELNGSLKEVNDVARDKKKKKNQKKDKIVTESIDGDETKLDSKSVLPEEETTDKKKKKKKDKNELKEAENDVDVTEHKKKKQKKKDKVVTDSIDGDEKKSDVKSGLPEENTKTSPFEETRDTKYEKKKKEKKKKSEVDVSLKEENNVQMTEAENDVDVTKQKKKKQKKNKLVTESIDEDEKKLENTTDTKDKKEKRKKKAKKETDEVKSLEPLDIGADNNQMSKKRKRSDEVEVQPAEETTVNDSKRRKSEGLEVNPKQIVANGETTGNDLSKLSKNGPDKSGQKQQRNDSAEPKTVHAFQRVKIDEVEFVDDRLQDNSYWAKSGAEKGYGAKAQEILGQVKGRDFRHEKTKKKRGSYRGGLIDQDSHSIKFNYSDEE